MHGSQSGLFIISATHNQQTTNTHKMASIIARPTIPYLPDTVFRNIMSYIVVPGKMEHKQKMQAVFTDITTMHLYNPVKDFVYYNPQTKGSMYDSAEYFYNDTLAVLQPAFADNMWYPDICHYDVRFQSTWKTRKTIEEFRESEPYEGIWGFYNEPKKVGQSHIGNSKMEHKQEMQAVFTDITTKNQIVIFFI